MEDIVKEWNIEIDEAKQSNNLADVNVILRPPNSDGFMEIPPGTRKKIIRSTLQNAYASLKKDFKLKDLKIVLGTRVEPRVINGKMALKSVFSLRDKTYVKALVINSIEGVEAKEVSQLAPTDRYFSVKARFGILIEGQTKGLQEYEERIVLIKAAHENEAEEKANAMLPSSDEPYLNSDKRFVWFKFEEVLKVTGYVEIPRIEPNLDGAEIFWEWKKRKLTPENTWVWEYRKEEE